MESRASSRHSWAMFILFAAIASFLLLAFTASRTAGEPLFRSRLDFPTDYGASGVAIADLNGDWVPDLAVANAGHSPDPGNVAVLLGLGDGTFAEARFYEAGRRPTFVAIGDLNGDQVPDLVVPEFDSVAVLLGLGDGTFAEARFYEAGSGPWRCVAIGDLNGDQVLDLAATSGHDVAVLLGIGDGSFAQASFHDVGFPTGSVAIGDLNGDQVLDLAVACAGNCVLADLGVLLGLGDGTFGPVSLYLGVGSFVSTLTIGDLNGDQVLDLAVAAVGNPPDGHVAVFLGAGDGSFALPSRYPTGGIAMSVAIGDLNGDGVPDLAATNTAWQFDNGDVAVLLGLGDGSFGPASSCLAGYAPRSVAIGDLNGDQVPDLVATHGSGPSGTVGVLLGLGDGSLAQASFHHCGRSPWSVAIGDLNGDQVPDLAVASSNSGNVAVLLGTGDGSFLPAVSYGVAIGLSSLAIGDLNGDLLPDLAVTGAHGVYVLLGVGGGSFAQATLYPTGGDPTSVAIDDLNGDHVPDLAITNSLDGVAVLLGIGDGTFAPPSAYPAGHDPRSVAIGDLNGDHVPDLAVANAARQSPGDVAVLLGIGDGTFAPASFCEAGYDPRSVAIGDLNGDHVPDLAVADWGEDDVPGNAAVLLGLGDGSFDPADLYPAGYGASSVAIGDLDGDQVPDLAITSCLVGNVAVLLGAGDGTFARARFYGTGHEPRSVATADLNGDRASDLAVANGYIVSEHVAVLFGNAPSPTAVELTAFDLQVSDSDVIIRWTTGGEATISGFHIHRGTDPEFDHASRVTSSLIPADRAAYMFIDRDVPPGHYWYWLEAETRSGALHKYRPQSVFVSSPRPTLFLAQNNPNPFTETTEIAFSIPAPAPVTLGIYDVSGRLVRLLLARDVLGLGEHRVTWDGLGEDGRRVPPGAYVYRLRAGGETIERKLQVLH